MAKLYFYYAAMNAGKSTTLLQADFNYRERGMETMLWTAAVDDRLGVGAIGSRIALSAAAHTFDESIDLFVAVSHELRKRKLDCILIDEAQFLSQPHVLQLCEVADQLNIPVLCYGLRTDFQAKLFPGSAALLALADTLVELKAVCECGRKATMNLRVDEEGHAIVRGQQTEIGGNDRYIALCRKHFFERLNESRARQLSLGLARPQ
jgi:thymidine kinase